MASSALISTSLPAATINIGVSSLAEMQDNGGTALAGGSIVQLGYFSGVSAVTDPGSYTLADWAAFTPISGIDSFNPLKSTTIGFSSGDLDFTVEYDTASDVLPGTNGGSGSYSARLGVRIFDSATATAGSNYNTVASSDASWVLNDPDVDPFTPPSIFFFTNSDAGIAWEDGANAGKTSLLFATVPEPSSVTLLGLGGLALLLRRKRS